MDRNRWLARLQLAIAAGSALSVGCGARVDADDDGQGGTGTSSGSKSSSGAAATGMDSNSSTAGMSGATMTTRGEATTDDGQRFDVGSDERFDLGGDERFDLPPVSCDGPVDDPGCTVEPGTPVAWVCSPPIEPGGPCGDLVPSTEEKILADARGCLSCVGQPLNVACGPTLSEDGRCCYAVAYQEAPCPGRPFTVDGVARLPQVESRRDWARVSNQRLALDLKHPDERARQALARAWAADGSFEAASVASFARFILELVSLGAPADLVAEAQRALGEEIEHARAFFGVASEYAGEALGPSALRIAGCLDAAHDPAAIAVALAREGCIAETISAVQLATAARRAALPALADQLAEIAEQEMRHAELAWRSLAWMVGQGSDRLRAAVAGSFARAQAFIPAAASDADQLTDDVLGRAGRLGRADRLAVAQDVLSRVIRPAANELLAPWVTTASSVAAYRS